MNELKFNSQICTTKEQSQRILELGLKPETADMSYVMSEIPTEKLLPQGLQDMLSAHRKYTAQANDINNEIIDREMKILHLPLKAKWYEMIDSGIKTEEYREIKPYWEKRLVDYKALMLDFGWIVFRKVVLGKWTNPCEYYPKDYTHVKFSYGYTKRTMTFEIESITIGKGKPEWGAPTEDVFIIKLGKRVLKSL